MDEKRTPIEGLVHLYIDGAYSRRELVRRVARHTGTSAAAAAALVASMGVVSGQQRACPADLRVPEDASDLIGEMVEFDGPASRLFAYLARPAVQANGPLPGVLVIHENRGLNDHIKDVARRVARVGYVALAIDLLSRQGGTQAFPDPADAAQAYGRTTAEGRREDMLASLEYLRSLEFAKGDSLGAVGFCAGGGNCFDLAVTSEDLSAAVIYYGTPPAAAGQIERIKAQILCHYAELDPGILMRLPNLLTMLIEKRKSFDFHIYQGARHAFNNDTGAAFDAAVACGAWNRTLGFFAKHLRKPD